MQCHLDEIILVKYKILGSFRIYVLYSCVRYFQITEEKPYDFLSFVVSQLCNIRYKLLLSADVFAYLTAGYSHMKLLIVLLVWCCLVEM